MPVIIDTNNSIKLAIALREIYEGVIFDDIELTNSLVADAVISAVEEQMSADKQFFKEHPGQVFAFESSKELASRFLDKISDVIDDTTNFVFREYSNAADMMYITVPYVLFKFGVDNAEIALFSGLGILVSKIVVEKVSKGKESKEKIEKEEDVMNLKIDIEKIKEQLNQYKANSKKQISNSKKKRND